MIQLFPPLTLDDRFSVQDLPDELQLTLLNGMVVPRIISSSMTPTIHEGDRLELSPPISLTVGTIVVFRNDTLLICHRVIAIDPEGTLWTSGDATQGAYEIVPPGSVIGVVTRVMRGGTHISLGQHPHISSAAAQPSNLKSRVWTAVVRSVTWCIHVLARFSLFQAMLAMLLRWTAVVEILTPSPLQSLPSHSKIASFALPLVPYMSESLVASIGEQSARYVVRLGPWRLAQYDPATTSLLLRQSLRDAGLESLFRQICSTRQTTRTAD
jgi:hypothetical protein